MSLRWGIYAVLKRVRFAHLATSALILLIAFPANGAMAANARLKHEWRWRGLGSSEYLIVDIDLNNAEAKKAAAGNGSGLLGGLHLPAPVNAIVATALGKVAGQVAVANKGNGVTVHIEIKLLPAPTPDSFRVTSR